MPQISTMIFDNALNSQNQDYLPSRYVLQKEIIDSLITQILDSDSQSLIGLIPIAQKDNNDILTPTRVRQHLSTFLHQRDLHDAPNHNLALFQADQSLNISELSDKIIFMLLGSPVQNSDEFLANIYNVATQGIIINVVCFGEAREFGTYLKEGTTFENLHVLLLSPEDNFNQDVLNFFANDGRGGYIDRDLEEAIKRSMVEK